MEKVYDLINESEHFRHYMSMYIKFHSEQTNNEQRFYCSQNPLDCNELLRFGIHHALCGENVYMVNFPRHIEIHNRPPNIFFLEKWADFLDINDIEHALVLAIANKNDAYQRNETLMHIVKHFKSFVSILVHN